MLESLGSSYEEISSDIKDDRMIMTERANEIVDKVRKEKHSKT